MKKLFLGLAVAASSLTFAQQFGVKGGMNVSSINNDGDLSDNSSKIGFNAGLFYNIPVAANFSIQPEVLYSQYGAKVDRTVLGQRISSATHLDYIVVPVMAQYNVIPNLYLEAGPELGFNVSAKDKLKNETNNNTIAESDNYTDNINNFNLGVGIGAGYYFTPQFGLTARYVAGVTDIFKGNNNTSVRNNVFQVGLAYKFAK